MWIMAKAAINDPAEFGTRLWGKFREWPERHAPRCHYQADPDWEKTLHHALGAALFPDDLSAIWHDVRSKLNAHGIAMGPASYGGHNDGDKAFIRAIWCLVRHLQARKVVETGVAHGVTSRFVLEAFRRYGAGQLWSIDLPPPTIPAVHDRVGMVVDPSPAWTCIHGSSRRQLRRLLEHTGAIDVFIHDSWHSKYNMLFELRTAWPMIRPGGAMVIDDIDLNSAFQTFTQRMPMHRSIVCAAEPVRPDPLRVQRNQRGLFGIILKNR
jgi:predicted O-methyltransferase YrrM